MKLVLQRVLKATVTVEGEIVGAIEKGAVVFVGITHTDTPLEVSWLAEKLAALRFFDDKEGKLNYSLVDVKGSALIVSQFTLYGDCAGGRRPSFTEAAPASIAKPLYEQLIKEVSKKGIFVQTGIFGAEMEVSLVNDGPITFIIERSSTRGL